MEISTKLYPRSVFIAGEQVRCSIQFQLQPSASPKGPKNLVVAWASVQLQCECVMVSEPSMSTSSSTASLQTGIRKSSKTSFRPVDWLEGTQIMSSAPKLLFCEMNLRDGEVKTFQYAESLPMDIPPSYRGKNIKFYYNILIGAQLLNSSVEVLKVPFRVLTSPILARESLNGLNKDTINTLSITNPFLKDEIKSDGDEVFEENLRANYSSLKQPAIYNIAIASGHIAKLSMSKKNFQMGDEIIASLMFLSESTVRCVQYSVNLICEEEIFLSGGDMEDRKPSTKTSNKVTKTQDFTLGYEECSLRIEIPLHATPSFNAALCSLSWKLQFEFVVVPTKEFINAHPGNSKLECDFSEWNAPQKLNVQTLEWSLPITIHPADPVHVEWLRTTKLQKHLVFGALNHENVIHT